MVAMARIAGRRPNISIFLTPIVPGSLSAQEGDPPPKIEQTRKRRRHIGQRGCREDAAGPSHVVR